MHVELHKYSFMEQRDFTSLGEVDVHFANCLKHKCKKDKIAGKNLAKSKATEMLQIVYTFNWTQS